MKKTGFFVILFVFLFSGNNAQVTNVNISGSYDGVFTLSNTPEEYKISGSPYLSENWMYGTLELNRAMISKSRDTLQASDRIMQHAEMINKCNELIQQISDPKYQATAFKLTMAEIIKSNEEQVIDVEISETDFDELPEVIKEFKDKLITFLTEQRDKYESDMNEINELNGLFRYNLYAQEFEMIYDRDTFAIKAPFDVKSVSLSNKKFIYGFYVDKDYGHDYIGSSYFEVLNEGNCKLLIRHDVKIKNNSGPVTYTWAGDGSDSFVKIKQLFYQKNNGMEVMLLRKNKKNLRKIFADKIEEIQRYIRKEKINVKDENDLIRVFTYYNKLDS
jgi:hypothetical protein